MNFRYIFNYLLLIFFLICCSGKEIPDTGYINLPVKKILKDTNRILGNPIQLVVRNDTLFYIDYEEPLVTVFDLKGDSLLFSYGHQGNGPGEFLSPIRIQLMKNSLYVYNRRKFMLFKGSINSLHHPGYKLRKTGEFSPQVLDLVLLTEDRIMAPGLLKKNRYYLYDSSGKLLKTVGNYYPFWEEEKNIPNNVKFMFHQSQFVSHPSKNLLADITFHTLTIYEFNRKKDSLLLKNNILLSEYKYDYIANQSQMSARLRDGFEIGAYGACCSEKYIYILYDPSIKGNKEKKKMQILAYDWNGKLKTIFNPKVSLIDIGYDSVKDRMIGIGREEETDSFFIMNPSEFQIN